MKEYLQEPLTIIKLRLIIPTTRTCIIKGVMNGNNILVTTPTSSGKTLIGLMGMINILN